MQEVEIFRQGSGPCNKNDFKALYEKAECKASEQSCCFFRMNENNWGQILSVLRIAA